MLLFCFQVEARVSRNTSQLVSTLTMCTVDLMRLFHFTSQAVCHVFEERSRRNRFLTTVIAIYKLCGRKNWIAELVFSVLAV